MPDKRYCAFIDEFGDSGLETSKKGVSSHFIVTSVIIEESSILEIESQLEQIRERHFQQSEIKSKNVASNDRRRMKILKDFLTIDFKFLAVVIDKSDLYGEGLKYKPSFHKFMHSIIDNELFRTFQNIKVRADKHGDEEFMDEFQRYVQRKHITLFERIDFEFLESSTSLLIQLADFICGTIARNFDETVFSQNGREFLRILESKLISLRYFPEKNKLLLNCEDLGSHEYNKEISELSLKRAIDFINKNQNSRNSEIIDQVNCIKFLLLHLQVIDPFKYVFTKEIIRNLKLARGQRRVHYLRSKVIAKLRDAGVLISSSNKGYKLPVSEKDLYDFVNRSNLNVVPIIGRVKKCCEAVKLATMGNTDILANQEYSIFNSELKSAIVKMDRWKLF